MLFIQYQRVSKSKDMIHCPKLFSAIYPVSHSEFYNIPLAPKHGN